MTAEQKIKHEFMDLNEQNEILRKALNDAHLEIIRLNTKLQTFEVIMEQLRKDAYEDGRNDDSNNI